MKKPVALLLEDEALIAMDVEMTLQNEGFVVVQFSSCDNAEAWLGSHHPNVTIVDLMLADGPCDRIVQKLEQLSIPFVVHSGDLTQMHTGTAFARGIWLNKPSAPSELLEAVNHVAAVS